MRYWLRYLLWLEDRFWRWLSNILPMRLIYWATVRACGRCTSLEYGNSTPDDVSILDLMQRIDTVSGGDTRPIL